MSRGATMTRAARGATPASTGPTRPGWLGRLHPGARKGAPRGAWGGNRRANVRALLLWSSLVLALAAGMVFLFYFSAAFVVKDLTVTGGREQVRVEAELLAQIPNGRPLARVSEARVRERVLADPRISGVTLEREWPSSVILQITERDPVVALRGGGETWLADAGGKVFEQVEQPSRRLPLITVQGTPPAELAPTTVHGLAELWRLRPDPAVLEGRLGAPRVAHDGEVTMKLDQVTLEWGLPEDNTKKWQVVQALIGQEAVDPQGAAPLRINLRNPDAPVVAGLPEKTD
ncbi:cell division protein FtsQ/DivIB [Ornithinimicrobium flavum]|uniref:cell division protein FtsQ/DivIB n=1 Tax=Ornithinimicrobium flavum TaxID=1288636 RepID=UPI00106F3A96|nr:FtsQ-type POTRA domain-containing protein [Ornithinimicrobium flavum]